MGNRAAKATPIQQEMVKATLTTMCKDVSTAVQELAVLGCSDSFTEKDVLEAGKKTLEICGEQVKQTTNEMIKAIRKARIQRVLGDNGPPRRNLQSDLMEKILFMELLKVALGDAAENSSGSRSNSSSAASNQGSMVQITQPWTKEGTLGKGAFGTVYRAVDKKGFKFAVKEVPRNSVEEQALRDEAKILGGLNHINIVKFFGFAANADKILLFMELLVGSIKDVMERSRSPVPESMAKKHTRDLLQGLIYLHGKGIIHRDIKCANVLLDRGTTAKLADMGVSKRHDHPTVIGASSTDLAGTIPWMSPEGLSGKECGKRSDVWAVGCTVYEMIKKEPPFIEELPPALIVIMLPKMIQQIEHRNLVTKQEDLGIRLQSFLLRIFVSMEKRPFAEQIADHIWLKST